MSSTAIACPSCKAALKLTQAPKGKIRCPRCKAVFAPHASAEDQTLPPSTPPRSQATQAVTVPPHPAPRETESNYVSPSPRSEDTLGQVADNGPDLSELEGLLSPAKGPGELGWLGPYRVLKILGQGGMGVVFLAEDPALERRVALKAMLPKIARNASAKDRFLREARAAAKLKHEHIVAIHQVGEDRGIPFLAIEFLEGEALDTCLGREGTLPIPEVLRIGKQIAEGLAAAHEQHLIHRDIKPANIWLERRKGRKATVVKILDFGLAKKTNDEHHLTQSGMIIGTPAYMPPEQAGAGAVDHRADLYSLGVVLYKMVTREVPFTGRDTMALLSALALQAPTPPVERNPNVPAELNALILKLLAKKPEDRPQSAEEVTAALEAIAAPTEIASPSVAAKLAADPNRTQGFASAVTIQTANAPRKRWPMALIGLLLLGFATTATLVFSGLIRIGTSDGDFVLDTDDPDFAFSVSKDKVLLDDKKTKRQYQLKVLAQKDGQYELEMTDADAGLTFHSKTITIRRGDKVALKAWFERKGDVAKVEPKDNIEPPPPDPIEPMEPPVPIGKPGEVEIDLPPWTLAKDAPKPALATLTKEAARQVQADWVKHLKRGSAVQENSVGMKLALVPPGEFDTTYTEPNSPNLTPELIRRRLRISQPFELGVTEVTMAQFRQFVEETKYVTDAEKSGKGGIAEGGPQKPEWTWKNPGPFKLADNLPVTQVSWNDANAFCEWLSKKEKVRYRLPTEAEWELACRAGSTSFHGVCDKEFELTQHAWVKENAGVGGLSPRPVGNWHANPFGLFDMIGNAWEWCADGGDRGSGERTHAVDPWGYFVYPNVRGPGYEIPAKDAHPTFRRRLTYDHARSTVGFRVLRQLSPEPPPGPLDRPLLVRRNGPLFRDALTQRPTPIPGLRSWSVELAGHGHHAGPITAIAWSPKGDVIATGNEGDPVIRLWDRQGKLVRVLSGHSSGIKSVTFSSDGQWLISVTGWDPARIWNATTGVCVAMIPSLHTNRPVFSLDGKTLAIQRNSSPIFLVTLDLETGRILGNGLGISTPNSDEMIAWSPDGKTIVTADGETGSLNFHSAPFLESMKSAPAFKKARMRVSWSPDGKWLAVSPNDSSSDIWIYDAQSREIKLKLNGNQNTLRSLAWSKDSKRLLSGGNGDRFFIISDALAGKELLRSTGGGGPVAWSPDETEVAVGSQRLQIFDAATGLLKKQPPDVGRSVSVPPHGWPSSIISADGKRILLRNGSGAPIDIVDPHTAQRQDRWDKLPSGRLIASPANDLLAVYQETNDKNLHLVDAATGKQVRELKPHPLPIFTVAWSPDGKWLASGGRDKIVRIWDVAKAELKHELSGNEGEIWGLAWSPDGNRLASLAEATIRIWDASSGRLRSTHKDVPGEFPRHGRGFSFPVSWRTDTHLWVTLYQTGLVELDVQTGTWKKLDNPGASFTFFPPVTGPQVLYGVEQKPFVYVYTNDPIKRGPLAVPFTGGQWHPDSRRFLSGFNGIGWLRGYDTATHQPLGTLVPFLAGDNWLVVGPTGHYAGPKNIEDHIVFVAQTESGEYITLTPADFEKRFGWKNDPKKSRLLGLGP